ncbi:MAG: DHH family phosphoesterase [Candidatus Gracilibacteria bacterium]|jgi:phosphoesterase RecJ-like protein
MELINRTQAEDLLRGAKNILIAPSSPMDGDSVGSSLALMAALRKMGKQVTVVAYDPMPEILKFLPFVSQIQPGLEPSRDLVISLSTENAEVDHLKYEVEQGKINIIVTPKTGRFAPSDLSLKNKEADFDLLVTVDTGDLVQLGKLYEDHKELFSRIPVLNIDHHASNGKFGSHNYLEYGFSATTQMITPMLQTFEKERGEELIDEDIATLLLVGIITDTGSFQHSNTTPEAFEVAADLLERGARQQEIIKHIFKTKSLATLKLWGRVLSKIQYEPTLRLVYSTITMQDLAETGANSDDTGGIIDELMGSAPGSEVVMLLKEKEPGFISGSFRAPGQLADVSEIAKSMNGGGHKKAAGFRIREKTMEEALQITKQNIANFMLPRLGQTPSPVAQAAAPQEETPEEETTRLFPGLASKPQSSIPAPSQGGEDMLLQDFRSRQNPDAALQDKTVRFFQDADGQQKPEPTVGDILSQMGN